MKSSNPNEITEITFARASIGSQFVARRTFALETARRVDAFTSSAQSGSTRTFVNVFR